MTMLALPVFVSVVEHSFSLAALLRAAVSVTVYVYTLERQ
jgi:hypothetical protein